MKIKFKVIAVGERFQIGGKLYRKEALSLAQDENRIGHLMLAETEVDADESVRTMADAPVLRIRRRASTAEQGPGRSTP
jgi:hypothetical protein